MIESRDNRLTHNFVGPIKLILMKKASRSRPNFPRRDHEQDHGNDENNYDYHADDESTSATSGYYLDYCFVRFVHTVSVQRALINAEALVLNGAKLHVRPRTWFQGDVSGTPNAAATDISAAVSTSIPATASTTTAVTANISSAATTTVTEATIATTAVDSVETGQLDPEIVPCIPFRTVLIQHLPPHVRARDLVRHYGARLAHWPSNSVGNAVGVTGTGYCGSSELTGRNSGYTGGPLSGGSPGEDGMKVVGAFVYPQEIGSALVEFTSHEAAYEICKNPRDGVMSARCTMTPTDIVSLRAWMGVHAEKGQGPLFQHFGFDRDVSRL